MLYLFLVAGLFLLPMLLRLAIRLRLGIPILYALASRVRQARASGESAVSTDGLWY